MYIVFEGIVGVGKSTQARKMEEKMKGIFPEREVVLTREPGGSEIADAIRTVVQATPFQEEMDPICEAYLYASSRAQTLRHVVTPVLARGGIVIADRSVCSSVAWQGMARGVGIDKILQINAVAVGEVIPDIVFYLQGDLELILRRTFDAVGDKFERMPKEFFEKCAKGYAELERREPWRKIWKNIDANGSREVVEERIFSALREKNLIP